MSPREITARPMAGALVALIVLSACAAAGSATPPPLEPLPSSPAPSADEPALDDLSGRFRHVGGEADAAARDAAVEEAIADIFFLGRGFARDKLLVAARIDPWIELRQDDASITLELGERYVLTAEIGGAGVPMVGTDGDDLTLTFRRRGETLVQLAQGERGGTRRVFALSPSGGLTVRVTIFAKQLPRPVDYELHYERAGPRREP